MVTRFPVALYQMCRSGRSKQNLLCCGTSLPYVEYLRNISSATAKSFICWVFFGPYLHIWLVCLHWPSQVIILRPQNLLSVGRGLSIPLAVTGGCSTLPVKTWMQGTHPGGRPWRETCKPLVVPIFQRWKYTHSLPRPCHSTYWQHGWDMLLVTVDMKVL